MSLFVCLLACLLVCLLACLFTCLVICLVVFFAYLLVCNPYEPTRPCKQSSTENFVALLTWRLGQPSDRHSIDLALPEGTKYIHYWLSEYSNISVYTRVCLYIFIYIHICTYPLVNNVAMGEKYIYGGFNQKLIYKSGVSSAGGYVHICTLFMYIYIHQLYRLCSTFYWFLHQYFAVGFPKTMLVPIPVSAVS